MNVTRRFWRSTLEGRLGEVAAGQVGLEEVRPGEVRLAELDRFERCGEQLDPAQVLAGQVDHAALGDELQDLVGRNLGHAAPSSVPNSGCGRPPAGRPMRRAEGLHQGDPIVAEKLFQRLGGDRPFALARVVVDAV
jgi:hypothetical protein